MSKLCDNAFSKWVVKKDRGLYLYGTVPPRQSVPVEKVHKIAEKLISEVSGLGVDALVIYDVQEESGRIEGERPYPFSPSMRPEVYVAILKEHMKSPIECIVYHALPYQSKEDFTKCMDKALEAGVNAIVLVGGPTTHGGYSVLEAAQVLQDKSYPFCIGGITLPERHTATGREHLIVAEKVGKGISFFYFSSGIQCR